MKRFALAAGMAASLVLTGCASRVPLNNPVPQDDALALPKAQAARAGVGGGVFSADTVSLTSDARAFRVGDVVTVLLQETTQASKKAGTSFSKGSSASVTPISALSGAITVLVQEVLPNGLLRVAGEKRLQLNQGEEYVRIKGYLRAADIDNENQVSSLRVANARIAYSGQGTLADANTPGWLTRFFTGPFMPF